MESMAARRRKLRVWVVLAAGFVLILGGILLLTRPARAPLQVTVLGRRAGSSGERKVILRVENTSRGIQNYAYWAEVQFPNGWVTATNWASQHPGMLHWIMGHTTYEFALVAPEGGTTWRLRFLREPQPSNLEWKWYDIVRRTGLKRMGLRDSPAQSYFFTQPITE